MLKIVHALVVAERDADDARRGVAVTQTAGCGFMNLHARRGLGEDFDRRGARRNLVGFRVQVVELVLDRRTTPARPS